jgi:hypothetical protein
MIPSLKDLPLVNQFDLLCFVYLVLVPQYGISSTGPVTVEVLVIGLSPNNDNYVYYYYLERMN